ncbi:hypothetical protein HGP17_09910 [Rhizobium sp. P38BS-XIX]|uniref:hypothetical protein n=1 Tax=Rhizobium sp. P38BS-XIX TaxID=2726740 RepID=UPI0014572290|nr:hypothetical protein [Rhizobium sp. P38BS-XIX]NLR97149.1 hypothetical protein [Rhizobium sp. P38BS-XIX]
MDAFDQSGAKAFTARQTLSKSVSDILTILQSVADHGHLDNVTDLHSRRLAIAERSGRRQSIKHVILDNKVIATMTYTCGSAAVLDVLQMLSNFFE